MNFLDDKDMQKCIGDAARTHTGISDNNLVVCDCRKCYGLGLSFRYAVVKAHRRKSGKWSQQPDSLHGDAQPSNFFSSLDLQTLRRSVSRAPSARNASSHRSPPKPYSRLLSPDFSLAPSTSRPSPSLGGDACPPLATQDREFSDIEVQPSFPILEYTRLQLALPVDNTSLSIGEGLAVYPGSSTNSANSFVLHDSADSLAEVRRDLRTLAILFPPAPRETLPPDRPLMPYTSMLSAPDPDFPDFESFTWDASDCFWPFPNHLRSPSVGSIVSALDASCPSPTLSSVDSKEDQSFWERLLDDDEDFIKHTRATPDQQLNQDRAHIHKTPVPTPEHTPEPSREPTPEPEQLHFQPFMNDMEPEPNEPEPEDRYPCGAFDDDPPDFRNFFIRTWLQSAFKGATNESIADNLTTHHDWLLDLQRRGELSEPLRTRLPFFPLTLRTLERRLGMDVNSLITIYSLCPKCGVRRTMEFIENACDPECPRLVDGDICGGILYTVSRLYNNKLKHTPTRSYPHISLSGSLERQLLRPGFAEVLQKWRHEGDDVGDFPPSKRQEWMDTMPMDERFGKPWDGWGWRNFPLGLSREFNEETGIYGDVPIDEVKSLVRLPLGLNLSINIDGFRAYKKADYSVQGVYVVINNLPTELRISHENMMLACVMPGPREPSSYKFNQILEPVVDELMQFGRGVHLAVYCLELNRPEQQLVHASLGALVVDYISRIKCNGHAGTKSELNFCLYCKTKRCYLSVPEGFIREDLQLRNPQECLQDKYNWLNAPGNEKEAIRQQTGVTFTEFDRLAGFFGPSQSPIDGMHLFNLGMDPWIFLNTLIKPGMFNPRHHAQLPEDSPMGLLKSALCEMYWPSHCKRLATDPEHFTSSMKAEQWRHFTSVAHVLLFKAWKVGDTIPNGDIPRGNAGSKEFKEQLRLAKLVLDAQRHVHQDLGLDDNDAPTLDNCQASRNARQYYRNILRYVVAMSILLSRDITRDDLALAQQLLERLAVSFTRMNVHLSPSFHYAMHVEPFVLKYGSLYNTWAYGFERANLQLQTTNSNGHGLGVLEATMARAFLKRTEFYRILERMQDIEDPTEYDKSTINAILGKLPDGPEHERQRGMLNAILAERTRLPNISAKVDFQHENRADYNLMVGFLSEQLPGVIVYGEGRRVPGGVYLHPTNSARTYSHLLQCGTRYGVADHAWGHKSRFGYINNQNAVVIRQFYQVHIETQHEEHTIVCAVIQRFSVPNRDVAIPWHLWRTRLQTDCWNYNEFEPREIVTVDALTGVFAMTDVYMSHTRYWITRAMPNVTLEDID